MCLYVCVITGLMLFLLPVFESSVVQFVKHGQNMEQIFVSKHYKKDKGSLNTTDVAQSPRCILKATISFFFISFLLWMMGSYGYK